jgi:hypothetical protein
MNIIEMYDVFVYLQRFLNLQSFVMIMATSQTIHYYSKNDSRYSIIRDISTISRHHYGIMYHLYHALKIRSNNNFDLSNWFIDKYGFAHIDILQAFKRRYPQFIYKKYDEQYRPLEVVKYLIDHRSQDIHAQVDNTLQYSALNGHLEVVKYLIDREADIHAQVDYAL